MAWSPQLDYRTEGPPPRTTYCKVFSQHHNTMSLIVGLIMIWVYDSRLIVHYESTMSSYFPLRYYVNTYNYLNPV